jgi:hypothetical protein
MFSTSTILISVGVIILLTIIAISIFVIYKKRRNSLHIEDFVEINIFKSSFSGVTEDNKIFHDKKSEVISSDSNQIVNKLTFSKLNQLSVKRTNSLRTEKQLEIENSSGVNLTPKNNQTLKLSNKSNPNTLKRDIISKQKTLQINLDINSLCSKKKEKKSNLKNNMKITT